MGTGAIMRVMLVEDNDDHAELVLRTLRELRNDTQVAHVKDGQLALDYLFRRGSFGDPARAPRPHIVLLDLRLPGVDGFEVLKIIKESDDLRRIPVVVLTTSDAERDIARAYDSHANSYLVKPVGFDQFSALMDSLCIYWLAFNTPPRV